MNTCRIPFLCAVIVICTHCSRTDSTLDFAKYLRQEKRLRANIRDHGTLDDSLNTMKERYNIDPVRELVRLEKESADWVRLLRELRRAE